MMFGFIKISSEDAFGRKCRGFRGKQLLTRVYRVPVVKNLVYLGYLINRTTFENLFSTLMINGLVIIF